MGGIGSPTQFGGELTKNKEIVNRLNELGYDITTIDSYKARGNIGKIILIAFKFLWLTFSHKKTPFLISTSFGNIYPLLKIIKLFNYKPHIVFWAIGGNLAEKIKQGEYNYKYTRLIDLFIVEGEKMKKDLENLGIKQVIHLPNFKSVLKLPLIQKKSEEHILFYFLSRVTPTKGCDYILKTAQKLNENGYKDKYSIDFYGSIESNYSESFKKEVNSMDNVSYKGTINFQDPNSYKQLAQYHYMLFPTYWKGEGFPGVIIDAYTCGTPILASDWNFNSEFVKNGVTGIIYKTHSEEELYQVMENAINMKYDNNMLSMNCQKEVWNYDTKHVITKELIDKYLN